MSLINALSDNEVHLWQINIDDIAWDKFFNVLHRDEIEKATRFHNKELQHRYRRCRSALRLLLAHYSGQHAANITLHYGPFGKPEIAGHAWHFNVSHSMQWALVAISSQPIGVDLEYLNQTSIKTAELIDMVCHPEEKITLALLSDSERNALFYQLWTQKEAYYKALGSGLQNTLQALRFTSVCPRVSQVCDEHTKTTSPFFVHYLSFLNGYAASVCLPQAQAHICLFETLPKQFTHLDKNEP